MLRAIFVGSFLLAGSCFAQVHAARPAGGHTGGFGYGYGFGQHSRARGAYVYPYPVYIGGGYGAGYDGSYYGDNSQAYAPTYPDAANLQPPPSAPPVIINQYFVGPPMAPPSDPAYAGQTAPTATPDPQPAAEPRTYLIAYKDHSVYTALAYWFEGQTLNYVTPANTHNQADLGLIDIEFTTQLNAGRGLPFSVAASR